MAYHVYRYHWNGTTSAFIDSNIDPAFPVAIVSASSGNLIDISADDSTKQDLDAIMDNLAWSFVATDPIAPIGTCAPQQITFRPGVPSDDCNKATWPEIEVAIATALGRIMIFIDDRVSPAEIPATANTECFGLVILRALNLAQGATLTILDGGRLRNVGEIDSVIVVGAPTATRPLYFGGLGMGFQAVLLSGAVIGNQTGATVAMIEIDGSFVSLVSELISDLNNAAEPTIPIVQIDANRFFGWNVQQNADSPMSPNLIQGDATTSLNLDNDASIVFVAQTFFLGSLGNQSRLTKAQALQPSSGTTAARPTDLRTGQPSFDTTLGIPIWWNGANWINAAGTIV